MVIILFQLEPSDGSRLVVSRRLLLPASGARGAIRAAVRDGRSLVIGSCHYTWGGRQSQRWAHNSLRVHGQQAAIDALATGARQATRASGRQAQTRTRY